MLIDLYYFPSLEYFNLLLKRKTIIEICGNYKKKNFKNKCLILHNKKIQKLTIPIIKNRKINSYKDIKIDNSYDHWRNLCVTYSNAPYFDFFAEYFSKIILLKKTFLFDLNISILIICLKILKIKKYIKFSSKYIKNNNLYKPIENNKIYKKKIISNLSIINFIFYKGEGIYKILKN